MGLCLLRFGNRRSPCLHQARLQAPRSLRFHQEKALFWTYCHAVTPSSPLLIQPATVSISGLLTSALPDLKDSPCSGNGQHFLDLRGSHTSVLAVSPQMPAAPWSPDFIGSLFSKPEVAPVPESGNGMGAKGPGHSVLKATHWVVIYSFVKLTECL